MAIFTRCANLTEDEKVSFNKDFSRYRPALHATGEVIKESFPDVGGISSISRVVIKGSWTPYGCMRDCVDHYIIARHSRYDRISKDFAEIVMDVEDR